MTRNAPTPRMCDCELGHNGMGMVGRECDCQPVHECAPPPMTAPTLAEQIAAVEDTLRDDCDCQPYINLRAIARATGDTP